MAVGWGGCLGLARVAKALQGDFPGDERWPVELYLVEVEGQPEFSDLDLRFCQNWP